MTRQVKVGVFVLVGMALITAGVFVIGDNRQFWQTKYGYHADFNDVAGLKAGAPVRLGGFDVGTVTAVGHSSNASDTKIHVKMDVIRQEATRVRVGTIASIVNKGLLGDKMVELKVPDPNAPPLPDKGTLATEEPQDMTRYLAKFDAIADAAQKTLNNVEAATRPLSDPKLGEDLKGAIANLDIILGGIARNDSAIHRLLMDPREGERIDRLLNDIDLAAARAGVVMDDVHDMTHQVRTGPGLAHAVLYDGDISKSASGAIEEVHKDLEAIRKGNGIAHEIIYGDDNGQHIVKNLDAMSDDLRVIVSNMRAGKGTLGALLVDPSVYEDIKGAIGNVERNQVLRALVRYSIKADEAKPTPHVTSKVPVAP